MTVAFLLVSCCLEPSRTRILERVVDNLCTHVPSIVPALTVFDNASTDAGVVSLLKNRFPNFFQADRNVGYWTAINWWVEQLSNAPPKYTYIIESDMIHHNFERLWTCAEYLDANPDVGSVRLHEYSVAQRHLYNKDVPRSDSRRNLWQSHVNKVTGKPVKLDHSSGDIWSTTFLTQLPALNRYPAMREVFSELRNLDQFSELDFQSRYWQRYQRTGILDGGIFKCDLNPPGAKEITGSWTSEHDLRRLGYQTTRRAAILPKDQYIVKR